MDEEIRDWDLFGMTLRTVRDDDLMAVSIIGLFSDQLEVYIFHSN